MFSPEPFVVCDLFRLGISLIQICVSSQGIDEERKSKAMSWQWPQYAFTIVPFFVYSVHRKLTPRYNTFFYGFDNLLWARPKVGTSGELFVELSSKRGNIKKLSYWKITNLESMAWEDKGNSYDSFGWVSLCLQFDMSWWRRKFRNPSFPFPKIHDH